MVKIELRRVVFCPPQKRDSFPAVGKSFYYYYMTTIMASTTTTPTDSGSNAWCKSLSSSLRSSRKSSNHPVLPFWAADVMRTWSEGLSGWSLSVAGSWGLNAWFSSMPCGIMPFAMGLFPGRESGGGKHLREERPRSVGSVVVLEAKRDSSFLFSFP